MKGNQFIDNLIAKMSIREKVLQMTQLSYTCVTKEQAENYARMGIGSFLHVLGDEARHLQNIATSYGNKIPLLFGIDAVHGHCLNKNATIFPTQLSMACSFNREKIEKMAEDTAKEVCADNLNWTFSPVLCLARDIRWGRCGETFGEDKFLAGELGCAMIRGYQGENLAENGKILACAKHFIGYGEATGGRDSCDSQITYRKLKNDFLPPFKKAIEENVATIMTAYGFIDGTPCTADKKLLTDILKNELNFKGFVVTDWDNVNHLVNTQHNSKDIKEASKKAVESGNDMMMKTEAFIESTISLVENGELSEELLNRAVKRILVSKEKLGLFKNPNKSTYKPVIGCSDHQKDNLSLARECVVLLKNDGTLPLKKDKKMNILVVGENAKSVRDMYGDWTYFSHPNPDYDAVPQKPYVTFFDGVKAFESDKIKVDYAIGCEYNHSESLKNCISEASLKAEKSDVIIFAFGDNIYRNGEGRDLANPDITKEQYLLFEELKKHKKPIISVMIASKPLCITEIAQNSNCLLTGFNPGAYGGQALAETIFGENNPSGKLPISFPKHIGQCPVYYNQLPGWHPDTFADMDKNPLFAFGEGQSYTKFEYSNLKFDEKTLKLSVNVKNTGKIKGKEIVQVYFRDLVSSVLTPIKQLIGFEKTEIESGREKEMAFQFSKDDFSFYNKNEEKIFEEGQFEIMVGKSSRDEDLTKIIVYIK